MTGPSLTGGTELVVGGPDGLAVGAVDVPHGPLRARHGGTVAPDDLTPTGSAPGPGGRARSCRPRPAAPRRTRRLRLDDDRLAGAARDLDAALAARCSPAARPPAPARGSPTSRVRALAGEIERVPGVLGQAARSADPSFIVAALRSLAGAVAAAAGHRPATDPLWPGGGRRRRLGWLPRTSGLPRRRGRPHPPTPRTAAMSLDPADVYAWTGDVLASLRTSLDEHGFTEILPAILSERFEPGARHTVAVLGDRACPIVDADDRRVTVAGARHYHLPVSHCVEKQLALEHADRVYCLAPCVRLLMDGEDHSGRHLCTFFQAEIEWHTESVDEVYTPSSRCWPRFAGDAHRVGSTAPASASTTRRGPRIERAGRHALRAAAVRAGPGPGRRRRRSRPTPTPAGDLTHDEEDVLSRAAAAPFWLTDYPDGVRDSLYRRRPDGTFATYDLVLPDGHGELATGGLRPDSPEDARRQAAAFTDRAHPYYAAWKARTRIQTGGIGFGVERLIRYCSGAESVLDLRAAHDHGPNAAIGGECARKGADADGDRGSGRRRATARAADARRLRDAARAVLDPAIVAYVAGGAGAETDGRRQPGRPRRAVARAPGRAPDPSPSLTLRSPARPRGWRCPCCSGATSPVRLLHHDAESAVARAGAGAGTVSVVSTDSHEPYPDGRPRSRPGATWFQLYAYRSWATVERTVAMAVDAGAGALVVTVDAAYAARADRRPGGPGFVAARLTSTSARCACSACSPATCPPARASTACRSAWDDLARLRGRSRRSR